MIRIFLFFFLLINFHLNFLDARMHPQTAGVAGLITSTKQIVLKEFPLAFNPSMIRNEKGYLMVFRYCPNNHQKDHSISKIGIVQLDENFNKISIPTLVQIPGVPHMEDPRIFRFQEDVYLLYNNCLDEVQNAQSRRDFWLGKLTKEGEKFVVKQQVKLFYQGDAARLIQKNWTPFVTEDQLYLIYMLDPLQVVLPDLITGECSPVSCVQRKFQWHWGQVRGGTPPIKVNGEFLAFFHSSKAFSSMVYDGNHMQYFMGAYTFSATYPFNITSISKEPFISQTFYADRMIEKKVVFPGGLVEDEKSYIICYGRNDQEIWIGYFDKEKLEKSLVKIQSQK